MTAAMQALDFKQNYFELFGIDMDFDIDRSYLLAQQRKLQANFHPDRFVNASDLEKRLSVQQASWINEAGQILLDPVKRSRYLLELSGLDFSDDSETTSDTAFLMEQIELREQLEQCRNHSDPLAACDEIERHLNDRAKELAGEFVESFRAEELDTARAASRKMQFIQRLQQQLGDMQLELEEAS